MNKQAEHHWIWTRSTAAATTSIGQIAEAASVTHRPLTRALPPWRTLGSFALVSIDRGAGRYMDDSGHNQPLAPNDLIYLAPTQRHRYGPDPGGWTQSFVVFDGPVFRLWYENRPQAMQAPVLHLPPRFDAASRLHRAIGDNAAGEHPLLQPSRLISLLADIAAALEPRPANAAPSLPPWFDEATRRLASNLKEPIDLEALAGDLNLSYSSFRRQFRQLTDVSPARFRAGKVIDQAKQLMRQRRLSDKQIAAQLGFTDPQHFSRRFTQLVGRTPSQFRASEIA